jgi:hypothetical protein
MMPFSIVANFNGSLVADFVFDQPIPELRVVAPSCDCRIVLT